MNQNNILNREKQDSKNGFDMKIRMKNFLKGVLLMGCIMYSPVKADPITDFLVYLYDIPASLFSRPVTSLAITIWLGHKIWGSGQEWIYAENKWSLVPQGIEKIKRYPEVFAIGVTILTLAYYFNQQKIAREKAKKAKLPVTTVTAKTTACPTCKSGQQRQQ